MTNKEIMRTAMEQSALDINCRAEDFLCHHSVIVRSGVGPNARKYYKEPIACNLVSYGNNVVASVRDEYREIVEEYVGKFEFCHCFETPNLHWLNERMPPLDRKYVLWQSIIFPMWRNCAPCPAAMSHGFWNRRIFRTYISRNGAMLCVRKERNWTFWESARMMTENS